MRFIPGLIALAAIAGCADAPSSQPNTLVAAAPDAAASAPRQVCRREMPTGSNMFKTVCEPVMTEAERRNQLDQVQANIRAQQATRGGIGQ